MCDKITCRFPIYIFNMKTIMNANENGNADSLKDVWNTQILVTAY